MTTDSRLLALRILIKLLKDKAPIPQTSSQSTPMPPLTREICFGVARHYYRLMALSSFLIAKPPKAVDVQVVVLMGLYQLLYLDKPEYATVQETVRLLAAIKKPWAKGLVNAVLRQFCRQKSQLVEQLKQQDDAVYSAPLWLIDALKQDWPSQWQEILRANDEHAPMSLRVNRQKITPENYLALLNETGLDAYPLPHTPEGVMLAKPCDVLELPGFLEGYVSVQDGAAQKAAHLLDLKPGLRVLDACCAPGGKTGHMLETEPNLAECVALDVDATRLQRVKDNLSRLALKAHCIAADARHPETFGDGQLFDRILLDAPCSAMGVIRRHPDIKLLRALQEIKDIVALQRQLLEKMWTLLKKGGRLVYATCSVMKSENEHNIQHFLGAHPDATLLKASFPWAHDTGFGWQILPGEHHMDGFFYSVLIKT